MGRVSFLHYETQLNTTQSSNMGFACRTVPASTPAIYSKGGSSTWCWETNLHAALCGVMPLVSLAWAWAWA